MKPMKRRIILIGILALALCFSVLSCARRDKAVPTAGETPEDAPRVTLYGAVYALDPDGVTVTLCAFENPDATSFTILERVEGREVKAIASGAFAGMTELAELVLPKSIKQIRNSAFAGASNLQSVFYTGDEELWEDLIIASGNEPLRNAQIYYYSKEAVDRGDAYWHYVKGVPTLW